MTENHCVDDFNEIMNLGNSHQGMRKPHEHGCWGLDN